MVEIKPLYGLTYNRGKIRDFSKVITPPNDVISKDEKDKLEHKSEFNFVNLILPESNGNKYQNSAKIFKEWQDKGILIKDKEKTIYLYSQEYKTNVNTFTRIGFISLIKLEELGKGVLPHEKILEKDLKDRIKLISTTKANFGVPFLLYDDKEKIIDSLISNQTKNKEPYLEFIDEKSVKHKLWRTNNATFIDKVSKQMKKYQCIIADGHHRYTSDLKVKDILGEKYGLMCFVNSFNEGMVILPTNRVIFGLKDIDMAFIINQLRRYFEIEETEDIARLVKKIENTDVLIDKTKNLKNHVLGIYSNINKKGYTLKLKENNILDEFFPDKTDIYKKLDVNILHKIIIEKVLGVTEEQQKNREHIDFIKGNEETIEKIKDENIQFCLFVNPPLMREVFLTARAGEVMPQKSTYFFPKVYSGLVTYKFEEA